MAIKKRQPMTPEQREAAIAEFGDGATTDAHELPEKPAPSTPAAHEVPRSSQLRWNGYADVYLRVEEIGEAEDRSQHKTLMLLLQAGIDAYDAAHGRSGR